MNTHYYNGKLLLFGEYAALFGAKALAVPSIFGQEFKVNSSDNFLHWVSYDFQDNMWLNMYFDEHLNVISTTNNDAAYHLQKILRKIVSQTNIHLIRNKQIISKLTYPQEWGLGSSSTMYCFIADLLQINVFEVFYVIEKGSGFDIACATSDKPIVFEKKQIPIFEHVEIQPEIKDKLLFVYLGKKQNSHQSIHKIERRDFSQEILTQISNITLKAVQCKDISEWNTLIETHENLISKTLNLEKVKDIYFSDFDGVVKSLGAWGGDFVMASSENLSLENIQKYFIQKGFPIVKTWKEILKY